jgi:hypothetical protein
MRTAAPSTAPPSWAAWRARAQCPSSMAHPASKRMNGTDPTERLNTYIYDYFLRNRHIGLARAMLEGDLKMRTEKPSPNNKPNGVDSFDSIDDMPLPSLPRDQACDNSFLLDWWNQFWDMYTASGARSNANKNTTQYIQHTRVSDTPMLRTVATDETHSNSAKCRTRTGMRA